MVKPISLALGSVLIATSLSAAEANDLILLSDVTTPRVAYQIERDGGNLTLTIEAASFANSARPNLQVALAADKTLRLSEKEAKISPGKDSASFRFRIPASSLVSKADDWKKLRVAFDVQWPGTSGDIPRLRQRFLHTNPAATHSGLSANPADWTPIDLAEMEREAADRSLQIHIDFEQPVDGKASIVIDNDQGVAAKCSPRYTGWTAVRSLAGRSAGGPGPHRSLYQR